MGIIRQMLTEKMGSYTVNAVHPSGNTKRFKVKAVTKQQAFGKAKSKVSNTGHKIKTVSFSGKETGEIRGRVLQEKGGVCGFVKNVAKGSAGKGEEPKYALGVWMAKKKFGTKKVSTALKRAR